LHHDNRQLPGIFAYDARVGLDAALVDAAGRTAWPDVEIDRSALQAYLEARPDADVAHANDLYLAAACLARDPRALHAFERSYIATFQLGSLARRPDVQVDEVRQLLAIKLLVADAGQPPALARYHGRGPLAGWVRVAATRIALDAVRRAPRDQPASDEGDVQRLAEATSVELDGALLALRERYVVEFRAALQHALGELAAHHRALLRLHYLERMTTGALAKLYQTSRNTLVRRIADARTALFEATIANLTTRVGLPPDQYETLLRLVRSQIDVSIERLLVE
jgi:RNA polymerase sigma-70 factor (ECF subfamily)